MRNRRVLPHARRFQHVRIEPEGLFYLAGLYKQNDMNVEAEEMYVRALRGYEKAWGLEVHLDLHSCLTSSEMGLCPSLHLVPPGAE